MSADRVGFRSELFNPLVHHLSVAKYAELAEEFARNFAHGRPGRIGVYFFHHRGDRPAAANGHTEVVHGVRLASRADFFYLFYDAAHPAGKSALLPTHP